MQDVERFEIPTPFDIGAVNCYLFTDGPLTLLDPGPGTDDAYRALVEGLHGAGYEVGDLDQILVTHPHIDHFGIVDRLTAASGATVLAHEDATGLVGALDAHFEREQAFFTPFLAEMGVPEQMAAVVTKVAEPYLEFQEPVDVDRELTEGDVVDAGTDLEVIHTPGHAQGCVCFHAPAERAMFTGDHVLTGITPNPVLTVSVHRENARTRSLPTYVSSLEKLLSVDAAVGYGGHREPISDLHGRVRETIDHHEERKEHVRELLEEMAPTNPYELMHELFGDLPTSEVFLGMSEVIGHLDLLEDEGRVELTETDGRTSYRPA